MASRRKETQEPVLARSVPPRLSPDPREAVRRIARHAEPALAAPHEAPRRPERADVKD